MRLTKAFGVRLLATAILAALAFGALAELPQSGLRPVKNVIIMVPDGTSLAAYTLTRWYKGGSLALDPYACGLVRTYSANSLVTDSAASATTYASGVKTTNGHLSVLPAKITAPAPRPVTPADVQRPVVTAAELAHRGGRAVGLVVTCHIVDATPAAFSAHSSSRARFEDIIEQQIFSGFDLFFGGGTKYLKAANGHDFSEDMKSQGYELLKTKAEMQAAKGPKAFGLFGESSLPYDLDRDPEKDPSLAELTGKAIDILSRNPQGFFLLIEGSKVDYGAHGNDPAGIVGELSAFDDAFKVALDFAKADGNTAIIVCADHGNGGIAFGEKGGSPNVDSLKKIKRSTDGVAKAIGPSPSNEKVKETLASLYGIDDLKDSEAEALIKAPKLYSALAALMSSRSHIGWTTSGHTGEEVALFCYAPGPRPTGVIDNTEVNRWLCAWLASPSPEEASRELFADIKPLLEAQGCTVEEKADPLKPGKLSLLVTKGSSTLELIKNRSYALLNGRKVDLPAVVVKPEERWFAPRMTLELMK